MSENYRDLEVGEILQEGDEVKFRDGTWNPISWTIRGEPVQIGITETFRRPINPEPAKEELDIRVLACVHGKPMNESCVKCGDDEAESAQAPVVTELSVDPIEFQKSFEEHLRGARSVGELSPDLSDGEIEYLVGIAHVCLLGCCQAIAKPATETNRLDREGCGGD